MTENADLVKLPEDEALNLIKEAYGYEEPEARFYLAFIKGEVNGDVIDLDKGAKD